jgi:hypothetical protein
MFSVGLADRDRIVSSENRSVVPDRVRSPTYGSSPSTVYCRSLLAQPPPGRGCVGKSVQQSVSDVAVDDELRELAELAFDLGVELEAVDLRAGLGGQLEGVLAGVLDAAGLL